MQNAYTCTDTLRNVSMHTLNQGCSGWSSSWHLTSGWKQLLFLQAPAPPSTLQTAWAENSKAENPLDDIRTSTNTVYFDLYCESEFKIVVSYPHFHFRLKWWCEHNQRCRVLEYFTQVKLLLPYTNFTSKSARIQVLNNKMFNLLTIQQY